MQFQLHWCELKLIAHPDIKNKENINVCIGIVAHFTCLCLFVWIASDPLQMAVGN